MKGEPLDMKWVSEPHGVIAELGPPSARAPLTEALRSWRARGIMPTSKSSAELMKLGREVRQRAVFAARMTNAEAVQSLADLTDELLAGKINMGTAIMKLYEKLLSLGYTPEGGFPEGIKVPPAEAGSLRDLTSEKRLKLMLETNLRMAAGYGRMIEGNQPEALYAYPAWELVRVYWRMVPRGSEESHTSGWEERWADAGAAVDWAGAIEEPMMALKDSLIWEALGNGEGGYKDALGNVYPPFAFGSGMGQRPVPRAECYELGLIEGDEVPKSTEASLTPGEQEVSEAFHRLSPDLQASLLRWINP